MLQKALCQSAITGRQARNVLLRSLSSAAPPQAGESVKKEAGKEKQHKESGKRRQAKLAVLEKKRKTQLCSEYEAKGSCSKPNCTYAHGMAELRSADFLQVAEESAKAAGRPMNASDLVHARLGSIGRRKTGLGSILEGLDVKKEVVSNIVFSSEDLDYVRMVMKAAIEVPVTTLANHWHLNAEQMNILKLVVGPRYNPDTDSFRLVKRNRAPFTKKLDDATVYDPLIEKLVLLVGEVKKAAPAPYAFTEDVVSYQRQPKIEIVPVSCNDA